ncbi:hypothetical protein EV363DRAFT_1419253 [Boletus edulis]|nr:hypothetical protein EV363DRAFT_1419253 [Boletus edulis]
MWYLADGSDIAILESGSIDCQSRDGTRERCPLPNALVVDDGVEAYLPNTGEATGARSRTERFEALPESRTGSFNCPLDDDTYVNAFKSSQDTLLFKLVPDNDAGVRGSPNGRPSEGSRVRRWVVNGHSKSSSTWSVYPPAGRGSDHRGVFIVKEGDAKGVREGEISTSVTVWWDGAGKRDHQRQSGISKKMDNGREVLSAKCFGGALEEGFAALPVTRSELGTTISLKRSPQLIHVRRSSSATGVVWHRRRANSSSFRPSQCLQDQRNSQDAVLIMDTANLLSLIRAHKFIVLANKKTKAHT